MTREGALARIDIFSPVFFVSVLLTLYAFWGITLYQMGAYNSESIVFALTYLVIFAGSFVLGYITSAGTTLSRALPRVPDGFDFSPRRLAVLTIVCLPVGLALFGWVAARVGITDPLQIVTNLLLFRGASGAGGREYVLFLAFFLVEAPFWAWFISARTSLPGRGVLAAYWLLILALSLLSGARVRVYTAVMAPIFVYHNTRRRISLRKAVIVGLIAFLPFSVFYQAQGLARAQSTTTETMVEAVRNVNPAGAVVGLTARLADAFEGFIKVVDRSRDIDYLWGRSLVDAFFLPIPRAWVPDKPSSFNYQALQQLYPERVGPYYGEEYSVLGELFMNWHILGIIVGGFIFGVLIKTLTRYYMANRENRGFVFLYRPLFLVLPMAWMTSGLINSEAHSILLLNLVAGVTFLLAARAPGSIRSTVARAADESRWPENEREAGKPVDEGTASRGR